jgi:hypothetical protein
LKKIILTLLVGLLFAPAVMHAATADVTAPIHQFIDGFNTGDLKSAYAAYAIGDITIIDEFQPHRWTGPTAPHAWAADFDKVSKAAGITDPIVKYSAPTRTEVEKSSAYVVIPATYTYKQNGKPMMEEGQMTFVLTSSVSGWKIKAWTWTGVKPHPAM